VTVADCGQRLHTEEETIEKPAGASSPGNAIWVDTVENGKNKIQADVNSADKQGELSPTQSEQPTVNIAPLPRVGIYFDELDLSGPNVNFIAPASPVTNLLGHEPM